MNGFRSTAVAVGVVAASLVPSTSYGASARWFTDARGDVPSSIDIQRVQVVNGSPGDPAVRVVVQVARLRAGDEVMVWLDTDRSHAGPEYLAGGIANSDALGLGTIRSWESRAVPVTCPGFRMRADQFAVGERAGVRIPRSCLGNPDAVRVSVRTSRQRPGAPTVRDFAPARHRFYCWVPR